MPGMSAVRSSCSSLVSAAVQGAAGRASCTPASTSGSSASSGCGASVFATKKLLLGCRFASPTGSRADDLLWKRRMMHGMHTASSTMYTIKKTNLPVGCTRIDGRPSPTSSTCLPSGLPYLRARGERTRVGARARTRASRGDAGRHALFPVCARVRVNERLVRLRKLLEERLVARRLVRVVNERELAVRGPARRAGAGGEKRAWGGGCGTARSSANALDLGNCRARPDAEDVVRVVGRDGRRRRRDGDEDGEHERRDGRHGRVVPPKGRPQLLDGPRERRLAVARELEWRAALRARGGNARRGRRGRRTWVREVARAPSGGASAASSHRNHRRGGRLPPDPAADDDEGRREREEREQRDREEGEGIVLR